MFIDTTKIPTHTLTLATFSQACDIITYMKKHKISSYVYSFKLHDTIMKYGVQYDLAKGSYGERIYRQSFHIPGWPKQASPRSAGNDMLDIIVNFPEIHRNDISIQVWDMTSYPRVSSLNHKFEVNQLERQLIKKHIDLTGHRPIGNIKDERHMDNKAVVPEAHFQNLFEVS